MFPFLSQSRHFDRSFFCLKKQTALLPDKTKAGRQTEDRLTETLPTSPKLFYPLSVGQSAMASVRSTDSWARLDEVLSQEADWQAASN